MMSDLPTSVKVADRITSSSKLCVKASLLGSSVSKVALKVISVFEGVPDDVVLGINIFLFVSTVVFIFSAITCMASLRYSSRCKDRIWQERLTNFILRRDHREDLESGAVQV